MLSVTLLGSCFQLRTSLCFQADALADWWPSHATLILWPLASAGSSRAELNWLLTANFQLQLSILDWLLRVRVTLRLAVCCQSVRPLRITTKDSFFQMNPCGNNPYVTSCLTRRWVCLLWIGFSFIKVKVTLRLAVYRQSVRLGVNPLRLTTRDSFFNWTLAVIILM
jgi:hypothetical protein